MQKAAGAADTTGARHPAAFRGIETTLVVRAMNEALNSREVGVAAARSDAGSLEY